MSTGKAKKMIHLYQRVQNNDRKPIQTPPTHKDKTNNKDRTG